MPRLTNKQYLWSHARLRNMWLEDVGAYALIASADQRLLHDYFVPSEDWSAEELLSYRHDITLRRRGLPSQAGRALRRFEQVMAGELELVRTVAPSQPSPGRGRGRQRAISVRAVVKPHPDLRALTRALLTFSPEEIDRLHRGKSLRGDDAS